MEPLAVVIPKGRFKVRSANLLATQTLLAQRAVKSNTHGITSQGCNGLECIVVTDGTDLDDNLQEMTKQALEDSMDSFTITIHNYTH